MRKSKGTSFNIDSEKSDVFSLGFLFLELLGIDNVKKFANINRKDEELTINYIFDHAIPYLPETTSKF